MKTLLQIVAIVALLAGGPAAVMAQQAPAPDDSRDSIVDRPGQIPAPDDDEQFETARLLLSAHHALPAKKVFEKHLDEPRETLMAIAVDEGQLSFYRKQALAALGYWPDVMVYELYTDLLEDDQTPENMRHGLMLLVADNFPEHAVAELAPYLDEEDLQVRLTAIEAIGRVDSNKAKEALERALDDEDNDIARERLEERL